MKSLIINYTIMRLNGRTGIFPQNLRFFSPSITTFSIWFLFLFLSFPAISQSVKPAIQKELSDQSKYAELPLGAIRPKGWLLEMLIRQKNGATGKLDTLYPLVMNARNGWLGGDGDQWERGPYWLDGLLPLAYLLQDSALIAKTKPWIEWAIASQKPDGYFGPAKDYGPEPGLQRDNSHDWWPKMVMLKVLMQYYSATGDKRVIRLLTDYFRYQLRELPKHPLDHWSFWGKFRGGDNLLVVYWLYHITREKFLLDLAELIHKQTFDYTGSFLNTDLLTRTGSIHGVNLAQGMKEPLVYFKYHPDKKYAAASEKGLKDLVKFNGFANGMYGGDEALHGNNPTQGSELCTAVELMYSLENMLQVGGNIQYADQLEKIAFNTLPAQTSDDYLGRQYFQQANQVMITRATRNFDVNHSGTDLCYGLLTGYPCCTSNMHQGWPKFTQSLIYTTSDKGIAALVYAPCEATIKFAGGRHLTIKEETQYPFGESIHFTVTYDERSGVADFPFHLRVPAWCTHASVKINGKLWKQVPANTMVKINRSWTSGDVVDLLLPMELHKNTWYENSVSVERGPVVYVLKIKEEERKVINEKDPEIYGSSFTEYLPASPWNYGLPEIQLENLTKYFTVIENDADKIFPWKKGAEPVMLKTTARRIPSWQLYQNMTGPIPFSVAYGLEAGKEEEEIILIPYGCSRLRIAEFPVLGR